MLADITGAVKTMDRSTQENLSMLDQLSASTLSLRGEVAELRTLMRQFQVQPPETRVARYA